jgi:hypothetical protein
VLVHRGNQSWGERPIAGDRRNEGSARVRADRVNHGLTGTHKGATGWTGRGVEGAGEGDVVGTAERSTTDGWRRSLSTVIWARCKTRRRTTRPSGATGGPAPIRISGAWRLLATLGTGVCRPRGSVTHTSTDCRLCGAARRGRTSVLTHPAAIRLHAVYVCFAAANSRAWTQ